mgnify:FL=1
MKNIILVGFMGCGKTTIGRKLAAMTDRLFVDMDDEIVKRAGMKITRIFEKYGEERFRKMETDLCGELAEKTGLIIATGGGVIKNARNMELLGKNGTVLYIKASPEHIYRNIKNDRSRPLLNSGDKMERIRELMEERRTLYETGCDMMIDISGLNSSEAARIIYETLMEETAK